MDLTEAEAEARRKATVERARSRIAVPAAALAVLGVVQLTAALATAMVGLQSGSFLVFAVGMSWCLPGALTLGAGLAARRLRGWNLVFSGLLFSLFLCLLIAGVLVFAGVGFAWAPLLPAAVAMALLVWWARLEEDHEIRAARNLVWPTKPRDPVDYQVL